MIVFLGGEKIWCLFLFALKGEGSSYKLELNKHIVSNIHSCLHQFRWSRWQNNLQQGCSVACSWLDWGVLQWMTIFPTKWSKQMSNKVRDEHQPGKNRFEEYVPFEHDFFSVAMLVSGRKRQHPARFWDLFCFFS